MKNLLKVTGISFLLMTSLFANEGKGVEADTALNLLKEGNSRFINEKYSNIHIDKITRKELSKGQHPFAVVVTCSDSRVSPEILFDQGLGDLFVIRTAGEVISDVEIGSIEYALEHLGTNLVVVLGHDECGAVKATIAGGELPKNIKAIADLIAPAVNEAKKETGNLLDNSIKNNVKLVMDTFNKKTTLDLKHEEVKVVGAIYDFDENKVEFLK